MTPSLMAHYNRWMNQQVYAAALSLPAEQVNCDVGAFFGSLLGTLNHIAVADLLWLRRFARHPAFGFLTQALQPFPIPDHLRFPLAPNLAQLSALRLSLDEHIVEWAALITADDLAQDLPYKSMAGQDRSQPIELLVQHFFNHQTHHRGQATTLLFQAGVDVGATDLIAMPNPTTRL